MSKKFLLILFSLSFLAFVGTNLFVTNYVEATLGGYKWTTTNSNGAVVKVRNASLGSKYSNSLKAGYDKWNNSGADISISGTTSTGRGIIDFLEVPQSTWTQNGWGTGEAWAQPMNIDASNMFCVSNPSGSFSSSCNSKVTQGIVWINSNNVPWTSSRREAVVAHEIGHIVGLAHKGQNVIKSSIMASGLNDGYDVTTYDVNEINGLY